MVPFVIVILVLIAAAAVGWWKLSRLDFRQLPDPVAETMAKLWPPVALGDPPPVGYVPNWPDTGFEHDWRNRGMGIWHCQACLTKIQLLPNGMIKDCRHCLEPWGGVHKAIRGWWHVTNGTVSEFARTRAEAGARFSELAGSGAMSQETPSPPLAGCRPRTSCSAIILGSWSDYECGRPVAGKDSQGRRVCRYHLSHPYAELIENMDQEWGDQDESVEKAKEIFGDILPDL
jgi:hypothetical protein